MTTVEKGFELIHVLKKFDGRVTRSTLSNCLQVSDREARRVIEYINNDNTEEFKDILIVSTSDEPGYKLAETEEEVMAYQREIESRIAALNMKLPKIHYFKEAFRNAC